MGLVTRKNSREMGRRGEKIVMVRSRYEWEERDNKLHWKLIQSAILKSKLGQQ